MRLITPGGKPASSNSSTSRWPIAGVSSDGLNTAVFPSSRLGPSIHSGTANGKFHGVMTATTPHGLRRTNASFSGISDASTSPDGLRLVRRAAAVERGRGGGERFPADQMAAGDGGGGHGRVLLVLFTRSPKIIRTGELARPAAIRRTFSEHSTDPEPVYERHVLS